MEVNRLNKSHQVLVPRARKCKNIEKDWKFLSISICRKMAGMKKHRFGEEIAQKRRFAQRMRTFEDAVRAPTQPVVKIEEEVEIVVHVNKNFNHAQNARLAGCSKFEKSILTKLRTIWLAQRIGTEVDAIEPSHVVIVQVSQKDQEERKEKIEKLLGGIRAKLDRDNKKLQESLKTQEIQPQMHVGSRYCNYVLTPQDQEIVVARVPKTKEEKREVNAHRMAQAGMIHFSALNLTLEEQRSYCYSILRDAGYDYREFEQMTVQDIQEFCYVYDIQTLGRRRNAANRRVVRGSVQWKMM